MPPVEHWAHAAIDWAVENGVVLGIFQDAFGPELQCTRAQLVTLLWRAAGEPQPETEGCPFSDVSDSAYYRTAVLWATETGVTQGVGEGRFAPNEALTRAQMVRFLYNLAGKPDMTQAENRFSDVLEGSYFHDAVCWALEAGVTTGVSQTHFAPKAPCTRAQAVTFLLRADELLNQAELVDEADTRLVDLGWSQFVTVRFLEDNRLENTHLWIDGVDITEACTSVTDDGSEKETIPHAVKAVLEDNLLGELQEDGSWIGARVPALRLVKLIQNADGTVDLLDTDRVMEGENVCILTEDPDYFTQLSSVNLNSNSADLSAGTDYSLSVSRDEAGQVRAMLLTLTPQTQSLVLGQTNLLRLRATGWQAASFRFRYEHDIETGLSVTTDKDSYARGEDVILTVDGSKGGADFAALLTELRVRLPNGSSSKVGARGYYSSTEYYSVSGNQITIHDPQGSVFSREGSCSVILTAQYYNDLHSPVFAVTAPAEQPEPEQPGVLPELASVEKVSDFFSSYYRVHFTMVDEALTAYLNAITAVSVNGAAYSKTSTSFWMDTAKYKLSNDPTYGGDVCFLDLTADGFEESSLNTVEDVVYSQTGSYPYEAATYYLGSSMPLFMVNRSGLGGYPAVGTVSYTLTITAAGYKTAHMTVAVTNSGYAISAQITGIH